MTRYFAVAAIAALMCASAALAAEDAQTPAAGGADTSTGAKEQSSAPLDRRPKRTCQVVRLPVLAAIRPLELKSRAPLLLARLLPTS
jgi:hypothetical protein